MFTRVFDSRTELFGCKASLLTVISVAVRERWPNEMSTLYVFIHCFPRIHLTDIYTKEWQLSWLRVKYDTSFVRCVRNTCTHLQLNSHILQICFYLMIMYIWFYPNVCMFIILTYLILSSFYQVRENNGERTWI